MYANLYLTCPYTCHMTLAHLLRVMVTTTKKHMPLYRPYIKHMYENELQKIQENSFLEQTAIEVGGEHIYGSATLSKGKPKR